MDKRIRGGILFAIILCIVDQIWLQGNKQRHLDVIRQVQKSPAEIRIWPAAMFYIFAGLNWYYFLHAYSNSWKLTFLFGFFLYSTFDLTNLALFKDYPVSYAITDTLWGSFAFMISARLTTMYLN